MRSMSPPPSPPLPRVFELSEDLLRRLRGVLWIALGEYRKQLEDCATRGLANWRLHVMRRHWGYYHWPFMYRHRHKYELTQSAAYRELLEAARYVSYTIVTSHWHCLTLDPSVSLNRNCMDAASCSDGHSLDHGRSRGRGFPLRPMSSFMRSRLQPSSGTGGSGTAWQRRVRILGKRTETRRGSWPICKWHRW